MLQSLGRESSSRVRYLNVAFTSPVPDLSVTRPVMEGGLIFHQSLLGLVYLTGSLHLPCFYAVACFLIGIAGWFSRPNWVRDQFSIFLFLSFLSIDSSDHCLMFLLSDTA
jgi:hypothetical protein